MVAQRHAPVGQRIHALNAEPPCWGDRRLWADRRVVAPYPSTKKRGWRLRREHQLLVQPTVRVQATRPPTRSKPRPTKPDEWWGIDMTTVLVEGFGWVYLVVGLEWYTKQIVGSEGDLRCTTQQGVVALDLAVNRQCPEGACGRGLCLLRDHGGHPTSAAFRQACSPLGVHQAFTRDNTPQGHAETARVRRTLKEECLWLHEWTSSVTVASAFAKWINESNTHSWPAALGYKPPRPCEGDDPLSHGTQVPAA
jgi:putative transposase